MFQLNERPVTRLLYSDACCPCHMEQLDQLQTDLEKIAGKLGEGGEAVNASGQA